MSVHVGSGPDDEWVCSSPTAYRESDFHKREHTFELIIGPPFGEPKLVCVHRDCGFDPGLPVMTSAVNPILVDVDHHGPAGVVVRSTPGYT